MLEVELKSNNRLILSKGLEQYLVFVRYDKDTYYLVARKGQEWSGLDGKQFDANFQIKIPIGEGTYSARAYEHIVEEYLTPDHPQVIRLIEKWSNNGHP